MFISVMFQQFFFTLIKRLNSFNVEEDYKKFDIYLFGQIIRVAVPSIMQ